MKFQCTSVDLVNGLSIATRALATRSTLPIFEGVLVETCEQGLQLTCSDSSLSIVTTIPAIIEEEGRVVLPGRLFSDVMRKMPDGEISATVNEQFSATFRCFGSRTTLAGQNAELFPELPNVDAENSVELPQKLFKDMIRQTSFALSTDESRMILTGSLLEIGGGETRLVALDGFRLAIRLQRTNENAPAMNAVIPGKVLSEVAKILSDSEEDMMTMLIGGNQLLVSVAHTQVYAQLIQGEYIQYRQIMPTDWKSRIKVQRQLLDECVDRAALMAREGKNNLVKLQIDSDRMIITSNSESGDVYEELPIQTEGDSLEIAFNVKYVSDVLRAIDDEEIYMCFNSPVSPCVVTPVEGDEFTYLILPVRVTA